MTSFIPSELEEKYEFINYNNAIEILCAGYPDEWKNIQEMLQRFRLEVNDIASAGGAETAIPGKIDAVLRATGWKNVMVTADLNLKLFERKADAKSYDEEYAIDNRSIYNYVKGPHVDFLKNRTALCVEWNKKDVDFDRCIAALRTFFELGIINVGIIFTRSEDLECVFDKIELPNGKKASSKYGASSTHMSRLTSRLDSHQAGGCPVIAIGIKSACLVEQ